MRPKQIAITIVSTTVLTLYTLRFMFWGSINSDTVIPYAIAYVFISGLAWKAILPDKTFLDVITQEGLTFPFFVLIVSGWSTVSSDQSFNHTLSIYIAFMIGFTISWVAMNVVMEVMSAFVSDVPPKPKRQTR